MPEANVMKCASHACVTGSGRVGRSTVCEDPVFLAVQAYARHHYSDYDRLLAESTFPWMDREDRQMERENARDVAQFG